MSELSLPELSLPEINIPVGLAVFIGVIGVIYLIFKLFGLSIKLFVKLLINALIGAALLFIFNFVFASLLELTQFAIPINWITAAITGVLGVPGVILILIYRFFVQ